jgi:hypothetical protein
VLPKMPPPMPLAQQQPSGLPFSILHPMSGYPRRPPPPPSSDRYQQTSITQGGHQQPMPMSTDQGHRQQAPSSQPIRGDQYNNNGR